jgi:hypothetical protein
LENLPSGAHPSACSSHRARAHVPEFISHATSMSRTARHAPAVARHLIPAPSAVRSSPALHSVLLHVTSFLQHRSPGIGLKPTLARAVLSSIPRRAVPFGRPCVVCHPDYLLCRPSSRAAEARFHPHEALLLPVHQSPSSPKQLLQQSSCISSLPVSAHASSSQLAGHNCPHLFLLAAGSRPKAPPPPI